MKTIYLLSGVLKEQGFTKEQILYLKKDIANNLVITFIPSSKDKYDVNDYYLKSVLKYFKDIGINFSKHHIIDNRISPSDARKYIKSSHIIYLLGGNPKEQMELINEFNLKNVIKDTNIIIGVSAGAMNQASHITYLDGVNIIDYDGLGLTDIFIYPHFNDRVFETEAKLVSKYTNIYCMPNDSFVRISDDSVEFVGEYYKYFTEGK